jgi:hypothetical protein
VSFSKPYQKSGSKTVHRSSRKAKFSATVGYLNPERLRKSKQSSEAPPEAGIHLIEGEAS